MLDKDELKEYCDNLNIKEKEQKIIDNFLENENNNYLKQKLRELLEEFDKTINPYSNDRIQLDYPDNYLNKVSVSFDNNIDNKDDISNYYYMRIIDLNNRNMTTYSLKNDELSFEMLYKISEGRYIKVIHYFENKSTNRIENGEIISINYLTRPCSVSLLIPK